MRMITRREVLTRVLASLLVPSQTKIETKMTAPIALFIGDSTMISDPTIYATLIQRLQARGYDIRSFGLPWSGDLTQWRVAAGQYTTWMSDYVKAFGTSPSGLSSLGTGPVIVIGTSRGAYCAFQLAAAYSQLNYAIGICPVIDLSILTEFYGFTNPLGSEINLYGHALQLGQRMVFIEGSIDDTRVGTTPQAGIASFIGRLTPNADTTVILRPPAAHQAPPDTWDNIDHWLQARGQP